MIRHLRSASDDLLHSPVVLQLVGLGILAVIVLGFSIPLVIGGSFSSSTRQELLNSKKSQIAALEANLRPLRGVAGDVSATRAAIDNFYTNRISTGYSQITSSLGTIAIRSGVRLSQIGYSQGAPGIDLTEISMDVGISGSYAQVMAFVNGVERDHLFFVVRALSFAGQQGGTVSLRIRISTWMRRADALPRQIVFSGTGPRVAGTDKQPPPGGK